MLKNVLSLLLSKFYSKKESEAVGHQAMPSASSTTLLSNTAVNDWGTVSTGVAANDGYLVLTARNAGNAGASLSLNVGGVARQSLTYPFIGAGGNAFVPIGKGDSWALIGSNSDNITLRLFKTIGGGYQALKKLILQGGGLCCLKHSYSSLRRSSCRVREKKLGVGLIQKAGIATLFTSMVSLPQHRFNIPHLRMELCNLLLEQICKISSKSRDLYTILRPVLTRNTQKNGLLHIIELQRDAPSNLLYSHSKQQTLTTSSLSHSTNSAVGGASC